MKTTRFARSLGFMDWVTQPDPFRRFPGADRVRLSTVEPGSIRGAPDYRDLFAAGRVAIPTPTRVRRE